MIILVLVSFGLLFFVSFWLMNLFVVELYDLFGVCLILLLFFFFLSGGKFVLWMVMILIGFFDLSVIMVLFMMG